MTSHFSFDLNGKCVLNKWPPRGFPSPLKLKNPWGASEAFSKNVLRACCVLLPFLLLHFTSSLFSVWKGNLKGPPALFFISSCFLWLPLLAASFLLLILGRTTVTQERAICSLNICSLHSTYVSFNLVIVQYSHWRGAVHTSHATEFQFHGNHQSFCLLGWVFASLSARVTRPWMWTLKEEGVPISVAGWSTGRQNSEPLSNWPRSFFTHFVFSLLLPNSHRHYPYSSMNNSFLPFFL